VGELKNRETHAGKWQTPVARYLPWYKRVERQVLTTAAFLQTNASVLDRVACFIVFHGGRFGAAFSKLLAITQQTHALQVETVFFGMRGEKWTRWPRFTTGNRQIVGSYVALILHLSPNFTSNDRQISIADHHLRVAADHVIWVVYLVQIAKSHGMFDFENW
jgi:hypothetical protein